MLSDLSKRRVMNFITRRKFFRNTRCMIMFPEVVKEDLLFEVNIFFEGALKMDFIEIDISFIDSFLKE